MTRERECQLLYWRSQQISVRFNATAVKVQLDDFGIGGRAEDHVESPYRQLADVGKGFEEVTPGCLTAAKWCKFGQSKRVTLSIRGERRTAASGHLEKETCWPFFNARSTAHSASSTSGRVNEENGPSSDASSLGIYTSSTLECICSRSKSFGWSWLWRDSQWEVEHKLTEDRSLHRLRTHSIHIMGADSLRTPAKATTSLLDFRPTARNKCMRVRAGSNHARHVELQLRSASSSQ